MAPESDYRSITVDIATTTQACAAVLVLYRQNKHSPVHAIAAEVWKGAQKVGEVTPTHCMGMRGNQVTQHIQTILAALKEEFGVSRFEDVIKEMKVEECPIDDCPLKDSPTTGDRPSNDG